MTQDAAAVRWTAVARCALGFAALGAGLIHVALAVGAVPWLAAALVTVGAVEFLWGVLAVSRPGVPLPRVAIAAALVPPAAWIVLLVAAVPEGPRPLPMLAATLLDLAVAIGLAAGLRRAPRAEPRHPLVGIAVAGVVVAAITVPALIATEAAAQLPIEPLPGHELPAH
jgi:hypothetical protein